MIVCADGSEVRFLIDLQHEHSSDITKFVFLLCVRSCLGSTVVVEVFVKRKSTQVAQLHFRYKDKAEVLCTTAFENFTGSSLQCQSPSR